MATNARKHVVPAPGETPRRQVINDLAGSINDPVPVANATARAQLVADLAAQTPPYVPSPARPLYVHRTDGGPRGALERTTDGTAWESLERRMVLRAADGSAPPATAAPLLQAFVTQDNVGGNGVLTVIFPEGFAKPPIVTAMTVQGAAINPVVDSNGVTAVNVRLVWPGMAANSTVRVHVMAIGWAP